MKCATGMKKEKIESMRLCKKCKEELVEPPKRLCAGCKEQNKIDAMNRQIEERRQRENGRKDDEHMNINPMFLKRGKISGVS